MEALLLIAAASAVVVSSPSSREYHFINVWKNWTEAQSYCREKFSDLATITNMEDVAVLNNITDLKQQTAWIGLYNDVNSWRWSFSDPNFYQHEEKQFRNWKSGEPNNQYGREFCGTMTSDGPWLDVSCSLTLRPVCLDATGMKATFVLAANGMMWTEAQRYCREHHSDLASVRNLGENGDILKLVPAGGQVWIGLYRDAWKWSDGSNLLLSYWNSGEPNNYYNNENCAAAYFPGKWSDWPCDRRKPFICHKSFAEKKVLKLKLENPTLLDLTDPAVREDLLSQLKQKLEAQSLKADIQLSWRKQSDGEIFYKQEEKPTSV